VLSRFRFAAVAILVGVGLVGATFYGLVASHTLGRTLGLTLGPYSDILAEHAFAHRDPALWQSMARRHGVALVFEPAVGAPVAFDDQGRAASADAFLENPVRARRGARDGARVTFYWAPPAFVVRHRPQLLGLLATLTLVIGVAFWFLQRQLRPLAVLHDGVDAVARGDFAARVPITRDDEIGRVAAAFNDMTRRVGMMVDGRERLLADVSHELRSPLARMRVALEFVPEGTKREAMARDLKEMETLIADLLEREALRSRTGRIDGDAVELNAIVGEVAAAFAGRAPGVTFRPNGPAPLQVDTSLMKLLVRNLLDNAIKFSRADSGPAAVQLETHPDEIVLRVADDGIGIPPGDEGRLFEPFVKLDRSRGHHAGYGLGLDLSRRIVDLHGGTIHLLPREPRGTEAVVRLPRRPLRS
jgi:signal transduction histidine kinase